MSDRKTILVGVDREGKSAEALVLAAGFCRAVSGRLHLVHVVEPTNKPWPLAPMLSEDEMRQREKDAFRTAMLALPPDCAHQTHVCQGHPVKELAGMARTLGVDLLVVGRHHDGATDHLIGGTAQRLVRLCPCPIFVHKTAIRQLPRKVLAAVDLSPVSLHALDVALFWARAAEASVEVLYVFEPPDFAYHSMGMSMPHYVVDDIRAREYEAFGARMDSVDWKGVSHAVTRLEGEPAPSILDAVRQTGADLIVLGTHGRTGLDRFLLGSVAEYVARRAEVSVLVVPP